MSASVSFSASRSYVIAIGELDWKISRILLTIDRILISCPILSMTTSAFFSKIEISDKEAAWGIDIKYLFAFLLDSVNGSLLCIW